MVDQSTLSREPKPVEAPRSGGGRKPQCTIVKGYNRLSALREPFKLRKKIGSSCGGGYREAKVELVEREV